MKGFSSINQNDEEEDEKGKAMFVMYKKEKKRDSRRKLRDILSCDNYCPIRNAFTFIPIVLQRKSRKSIVNV